MVGFFNYTVILTYIGVASAVTGIGFAAAGRTDAAIVCLLISGLCDLFDGSVAKTMKNRTEPEKKFGIEIDSLADLVCFGVAPAAVGYSLGLGKWYEVAILALYVLAALIRLGYYNVTEDELQINKRTQRISYDGLPVTTASLLIPFIYAFKPLMAPETFQHVYMSWLLIISVAFVTKIKIRKLGMKGMIAAACLGALVLAALITEWSLA